MSAIFYFLPTLPQAKYLFHFLKKNYLYKVESQSRLSRPIDVGVRRAKTNVSVT